VNELHFLEDLERVIRERLTAGSSESYTARLAASGVAKVAQKVGEEGVELALAAVADDDARVAEEAADLLYHVLVLLAVRGLALDNVVAVLERRHRPS
jgi:phosphoribosyl-ATP pyrophosphohydrolase/phosphoribosyl-AMP cyclohydrolase